MSGIPNQGSPRFCAVAFDLLTALMNSWSLWIKVAGDDALDRGLHRKRTFSFAAMADKIMSSLRNGRCHAGSMVNAG